MPTRISIPLLASLLLATGASALAATPSTPNAWPSLDATELGVRAWSAEAVQRVEIDVPDGTIRLAATDDVTVNVGSIAGPRGCGVHMMLDEGVLTIDVPAVSGVATGLCSPDLTVGVPATIPVHMDLRGARVSLHEVESPLTITGRAARVAGSYAGEQAEITLARGHIRLTGLVTTPIATTGQGRLRLSYADASATRPTHGGDPESDETGGVIRTSH